jgi:hypothetical protein
MSCNPPRDGFSSVESARRFARRTSERTLEAHDAIIEGFAERILSRLRAEGPLWRSSIHRGFSRDVLVLDIDRALTRLIERGDIVRREGVRRGVMFEIALP